MTIVFYTALSLILILLAISFLEKKRENRFFYRVRDSIDTVTYRILSKTFRVFIRTYRNVSKTVTAFLARALERSIHAVERALESMLVWLLDLIRGKRVLRHNRGSASSFLQDVHDYKKSLPRQE
ncbi:MAG: hypothetical protein WDZ88_01565 [Candidatus Paceibacterota bacterium]